MEVSLNLEAQIVYPVEIKGGCGILWLDDSNTDRMIAYVDCLSTEPAAKCWNRTYYEDEDELLPLYTRKLSNLKPKTEGSLRRRLLTSKIHQQQDALWAPKPWAGPPRKVVSQQGQTNCTFGSSVEDRKGSKTTFLLQTICKE